jgi:hypothetical protein
VLSPECAPQGGYESNSHSLYLVRCGLEPPSSGGRSLTPRCVTDFFFQLQSNFYLIFLLLVTVSILYEMTYVRVYVCTARLVGRFRDRFPVVSLGIFSVVPNDGTMCPGVDSASGNEYQGFLLG